MSFYISLSDYQNTMIILLAFNTPYTQLKQKGLTRKFTKYSILLTLLISNKLSLQGE